MHFNPMTPPSPPANPSARASRLPMLQELRTNSVIRPEDWDHLPMEQRQALEAQPVLATLVTELVARKLLTEYQASRIGFGKISDLIVGPYRVLDCLGSGGMATVLKGEHIHLGRTVAIKIMHPTTRAESLKRFASESRVLAQFQHPNIIAALDAGEIPSRDGLNLAQHYLVTEYVPGQDLYDLVKANGRLPTEKACDLMYQIASALAEVHKQQRVHRDIKPNNIRVTPEGQAKLLDFGLTRDFRAPVTELRSLLGTLEYLAPEQANDAHLVDIRADIFGLGGTLFWCLTGRSPFPTTNGNLLHALQQRQTQTPPSARLIQPDVPEALERLITRMLAIDPNDRPPTPDAVMRALLPFLRSATRDSYFFHTPQAVGASPADRRELAPHIPRILIVDDELMNRALCRHILEREGVHCEEASDGVMALEAIRAKPYDLVLLDIDMPRKKGTEVLKALRENPPTAHLKVMMLSGRISTDEMAEMLAAGATDYMAKPFTVVQMVARVKAALQLKTAQDRMDLLSRNLLTINQELENTLHARDSDLIEARNALVLALAELVATRDTETGAHLLRLQHYSRRIAEEAATLPAFAEQIDLPFIQMVECCAPLHDIGKAGVPDAVLLKPGKLTPEERAIMQTHTTIGAAVLQKAARQHRSAVIFFHMAIDIARHHHERYDGTGYPDRLAGSSIPLAARVVALADVYDALRSRRTYKAPLTHAQTIQIMTESSQGHFDPGLFHAFQRCAGHLDSIFIQYATEDIG